MSVRTLGLSASFDAGRGCPYQCSFCTIINVQGRISRYRTADDVERLVRLNWAQGIHKFFITDDNFARNREWESTFDRLIELREKHGIPIGLLIQVDALCHKIPNFMAKAKRAGVSKVFIGLENINPENLAGAKKRQNKITEYRKMLLGWKAQGMVTIAGYILGFPADTPETIRRDIEIIKHELPIDLLEFFCLTPLPGSEDHQTLWKNGVAMDPDLNKYDAEHVCTAHPKMSKDEWQGIYREAWSLYYTPAHMKTLLRRAHATRRADAQSCEISGDVLDHRSDREGASVAGRNFPPQASVRAQARPAAPEPVAVLAAVCLGDAAQARRAGADDRLVVRLADHHRLDPQFDGLHGSGADAGRRRRRRDTRSDDQDHRRGGGAEAPEAGGRADPRARPVGVLDQSPRPPRAVAPGLLSP